MQALRCFTDQSVIQLKRILCFVLVLRNCTVYVYAKYCDGWIGSTKLGGGGNKNLEMLALNVDRIANKANATLAACLFLYKNRNYSHFIFLCEPHSFSSLHHSVDPSPTNCKHGCKYAEVDRAP